jgi:hypothetical protein
MNRTASLWVPYTTYEENEALLIQPQALEKGGVYYNSFLL